MAKLNGLQVTSEDIFTETALLLDLLLSRSEINQHNVDKLWELLIIRIRGWKPDATDYDRQMVSNTVFHVVRALLAQHIESRYSDTLCDMLIETIEKNSTECDEEEQKKFLQVILDQSPKLCDWINNYDEANSWLSDQIADAIAGRSNGVKLQESSNVTGSIQTYNNIEVPPLPSFGLSSEKQKHWSGVYSKLVLTKWLRKEDVKQLEFVYIMCAVGDIRYKRITWYGPTNALAYIVRQHLQVEGVDRWTIAPKVFLDRKSNPLPESFPNTKAPSSSTMKKIDNIFKISKE